MNYPARRQQPSITIRSTRALDLLRRLGGAGRSQAEIIEEALEQLASRQHRSLGAALTPDADLSFDWTVPRAAPIGRAADLGD